MCGLSSVALGRALEGRVPLTGPLVRTWPVGSPWPPGGDKSPPYRGIELKEEEVKIFNIGNFS